MDCSNLNLQNGEESIEDIQELTSSKGNQNML